MVPESGDKLNSLEARIGLLHLLSVINLYVISYSHINKEREKSSKKEKENLLLLFLFFKDRVLILI